MLITLCKVEPETMIYVKNLHVNKYTLIQSHVKNVILKIKRII